MEVKRTSIFVFLLLKRLVASEEFQAFVVVTVSFADCPFVSATKNKKDQKRKYSSL